MKNLLDILNKKYDDRLVDHKLVKKKWKKMKEHFEECAIVVKTSDDVSYFQYEIIEKSLQVKERFEDTFFDMYIHMHDYWYDLTYQERKKQMNIEIDKLVVDLSCFQVENQKIYMPCFEPKFNHLYTDEIVLLDLKQYRKFIRTFGELVKFNLYGMDAFLHGFSSAHVMAYQQNSFVLYHEFVNRFYLFKDQKFVKSLSLHPKKIPEDGEILYALAEQFLIEDEDAILEILLQSELDSKRHLKKLKKYQQKKAKRIAKQQKKETKNNRSE